ncbi:1,4-alpha-glucan branching protein [Streptomyces sp. ME02-8801-2C]|uniref:maltokinase N-terminal cap-like domain-containing protein n=1 Tax=Streptomyces sp. ME02-8801-2C TaxID=3028680 RepID=UPI0029A5CE7D|nr:1,4-alpha-glucan branching protein [Streptomyces sp. ME02-8801-2C]MDX3456876.1 1,4-alpha-glucan branching protein [Streptomyces sp. ME02-8801-2C]
MAVIHHTTLTPTKLELLTAWLPTRPWYVGAAGEPELAKAGGFRLDDPEGEVGIEVMVVTDTSGERPVAYLVPLSYRNAPLGGAEQAVVGTAEHGVLGKRWIYDGTHDPVVVGQLLALVQDRAEAQAQGVSDTPDPSVTGGFTGAGVSTEVASLAVTDGVDGTDVVVKTVAGEDPSSALALRVMVTRVLTSPQPQAAPIEPTAPRGQITAGWHLPDGSEHRAPFVVIGDAEH